jgi:hypothetical protein
MKEIRNAYKMFVEILQEKREHLEDERIIVKRILEEQ